MSNNFFDANGRCVTNLTKHQVYQKSRNYFQLDKKKVLGYNNNKIFNNLKNYLCKNLNFNETEFEKKIINIKDKIKKDDKISNILKGFSIPFIIPKLENDDIGTNIEEIFIPALQSSFKNEFEQFELINHIKNSLKNQLDIWTGSKYEKITERLNKQNITGLLFPSLNEFSFPAAIETVSKLPENIMLAGGYEIMSALIGSPSILKRDDGYPPLLWFSSLKSVNDSNIGYHIEPYGYNLTLNRRAHIDNAAEYWWHSVVIIED